MTKPLAVVIGAGPGIGAAVARKFSREGFRVALVARTEATLASVAQEIPGAIPVAADAGDAASVAGAFRTIRERGGDASVLVYNTPGPFKLAGILEIDPAEFEAAWRVSALGALLAAREVLPAMIARGEGTLLFTGATAALRGGARFSLVAAGKFTLRALAQSIAREFGPKGIHAAHVIVDGAVLSERAKQWMPDRANDAFLAPDAIAETYWMLHRQHPTAWTQELDLRPAVEKF